jgi:hypothetical protein
MDTNAKGGMDFTELLINGNVKPQTAVMATKEIVAHLFLVLSMESLTSFQLSFEEEREISMKTSIKMVRIIFFCLTALQLNAMAEDQRHSGGKDEHFAEMKADVIKRLNAEKSAIDLEINCANSASNHEAIHKCREVREAEMEKLRSQQRESRKKHLQEEINKIDQEGKKK